MRHARLLVGGGLLVVAAVIGARAIGAEGVLRLIEYVRASGAVGIAVFAAAYVAATVLFLPGAVLTLAAGFLWGPIIGILIVSPVSVAAATAAFVLGRTLARDWIAGKLTASPRFARVDEAVGREGFRIILLLRLSPVIPFNLLNYALGLTRVPLREYVLASWIGMIPGTFLYLYLGSTLTTATELLGGPRARTGGWEHALYWGGLAATVLAAGLLARIARRSLDRSLEPRSGGPEGARR